MNQPKSEKLRDFHPFRPFRAVFRALDRAIAGVCLGLIGLYRLVISPLLHALLGPQSGCRHEPSCSRYAIGCFRTHPAPVAFYYAVRRVLRCHPLNPGGYDPVPPRRNPPARQ